MNSKDINLMQLEAVALALGELLPQVTFVGGSTTVLLVDDAANCVPGRIFLPKCLNPVSSTIA